MTVQTELLYKIIRKLEELEKKIDSLSKLKQ